MRARLDSAACFGSFILILGAPAVAIAQDGSEPIAQRTLEGAQQFLVDFYAQAAARAKAGGYVRNGSWQIAETPGSTHQMIEGPVVAVATIDRCKSMLTVHPAVEWRFRQVDPKTPIAANAGRLNVEIDWSSIKKLVFEDDWLFHNGGRLNTGYKNIILWGLPSTVILSHPSNEDAERVGFAIQFLADQCGFKTETGF